MEPIDRSDLEGPKIDRRTTLKLLSAAGLGGLAGCTGGDSEGTPTSGDGGDGGSTPTSDQLTQGTPTATATPPEAGVATGGTVEMGVSVEQIVELDPHLADLTHELGIIANVYNALTKFNARTELVGDLAKDWTLPDDTTYEFQLHEGVRFHDGSTLNASAVKWSMERVKENSISPDNGKMTFVDSIEAPDSHLVRVNMSKPTAPFIVFTTILGNAIVPKSAAPFQLQEEGSEFSRNPVGSGPFKYDGRSQGEVLRTVRNENYWETDADGNQLPYLDGVNYRLIPEKSTMFTAIKSGNLHYASRIGAQNANLGQKLPNINVNLVGSGLIHFFMYLNENPYDNWEDWSYISTADGPPEKWKDEDPPTADPRVRRAIAMAIDREELVKRAYLGQAAPAHTILGPSMPWAYDEKPENAQVYDPERAKELLDEAGYSGSTRFSANFVTTGVFERPSTVIQEQLGRVGIDIEMKMLQNTAYWTRAYEFKDLFRFSYTSLDTDPYQRWWLQLHSVAPEKGAGLWNANLYSNEEFDATIEESLATPVKEERRPIVKEAEQIFLKDAALTTLAYPLTGTATRKNIKQIREPLSMWYFHQTYMEE